MENDIQYFTAVIDTCNLISSWLQNKPDDIINILSTLEINLESKYGPFTSKLSKEIGLNETLGLKTPDSYWKGVQDTIALFKNFINWKKVSQSPRTIENLLLETLNKSNVKITPDESPLISALGISFETDFRDNTFSGPATSKPKTTFDSIQANDKDLLTSFASTLIKEKSVIDNIPEISSTEDDPDKAFNPKEFIDDEKFLDQFIADSLTPETVAESSEQPLNSDRDYLRSALEELAIPNDENENEKDIQIQFQEAPSSKLNQSPEKKLSSIESIEEDLEEKNSSRLFSSSLRDALRMLREEE